MTYDIVVLVSVCIDMFFWRWSLQPKHVKDEWLKNHNIYQSHRTVLIIFYTTLWEPYMPNIASLRSLSAMQGVSGYLPRTDIFLHLGGVRLFRLSELAICRGSEMIGTFYVTRHFLPWRAFKWINGYMAKRGTPRVYKTDGFGISSLGSLYGQEM
jgi:hypothetical protein